MRPLLPTFIRLTALIAAIVIAFLLFFIVLKIVIVAAVLAALVLGGFFIYNLFRRRVRLPVIR